MTSFVGLQKEQLLRDQAFFDCIREKLDEFFVKVILPQIVTGKITESSEKESEG